MDREEFVNICKAYYSNSLNTEVAFRILYNYCMEKNKDINETQKFLNIIINMPAIFYNCLSIAIEYYEHKFNIVKTINISTNTILFIY